MADDEQPLLDERQADLSRRWDLQIGRVGELPRCSIGGGYSHSLRTGNGYSN